ncbi:peptidoglycan-binding protein [Rhodobacteraceae bacterium 2376]|uniref:Peptidoglycan-binding protein n=1 Tax=Rhabdonatronobacter sediminivivens TaxID=2743469 RepID=A0A7Z0I140_9RHOB|nr:peptidoglycan-binding domain-containing protein [Rhabdonatronobacter sediminivivens]NYS25992.1 peptidoglycan-binding protein [Rhabdonatronobacter sediminivivens]
MIACAAVLGACQTADMPMEVTRGLGTAEVTQISDRQAHGCWGHTDVPGQSLVQTPCPEDVTPAFIESLQRALSVRGYMAPEITGDADDRTRAAVQAYQAARGFNSPILSLQTARELGLVPYDASEF